MILMVSSVETVMVVWGGFGGSGGVVMAKRVVRNVVFRRLALVELLEFIRDEYDGVDGVDKRHDGLIERVKVASSEEDFVFIEALINDWHRF